MMTYFSARWRSSARALAIASVCGLFAACGGDGVPVTQGVSTDSPSSSSSGSGSSGGTTSNIVVPSVISASPLQFLPYDIVSGFSYSYGFTVHDYDRDGKPDVSAFDSWVVTRSDMRPTPNVIGYMKWNSGTLDTIVPTETFDYSASPVTAVYLFERHVPADINQDGWDDIVGVVNSHDSVVAYMNPGQRGTTWPRRLLSNNTPGAVNLAVADVNNDGLPDVFVAMRLQYTASYPAVRAGIAWLENTGQATGEWTYHNIDTSDYFQDARTVQAGDINQDGKLDVLVSDTITGKVAWYAQGAGDVWTRNEIPGVNVAGAHFGKLLDMDGDGQLDIVMPTSNGVVLLTNVNKGASWNQSTIAQFPADWNGQVTEVAVGDIDGDGLLDVVFTVYEPTANSPNAGGAYWATRKGGTNGAWQVYRLYAGGSKAAGVQLIDYDGDGKLDVVVNREYESMGVTLWMNKGVISSQ